MTSISDLSSRTKRPPVYFEVARCCLVDIEVRLVELVVAAGCAVDGDGRPGSAGRRRRRSVALREEGLRLRHVDDPAQARSGARRFERVDRLPRNVDERTARRREGGLALDAHSHFALDDGKPLTCVGMEAGAHLRARRGRHVFAGQSAIVDDQLAPVRLALCFALRSASFTHGEWPAGYGVSVVGFGAQALVRTRGVLRRKPRAGKEQQRESSQRRASRSRQGLRLFTEDLDNRRRDLAGIRERVRHAAFERQRLTRRDVDRAAVPRWSGGAAR